MLAKGRAFVTRHAIACLALFIALGGTALALPGKHLIDRNDLRKNVVKTRNIARGAVTPSRIKRGAVGVVRIKRGAVTQRKIAPDAVGDNQLDTGNITSFVQGNGELQTMAATANATGLLSNAPVLANVPGFGRILLRYCSPSGTGFTTRIQILSDDTAQNFLAVGQGSSAKLPGGPPQAATVDGTAGTLGGGGGTLVTAQRTPGGLGISATFDVSMSRGTGADSTGAHTSVAVYNNGSTCSATAQTMIQK